MDANAQASFWEMAALSFNNKELKFQAICSKDGPQKYKH